MTKNLRTLTREKREVQMNIRVMPTTPLATLMILVLASAGTAFSQTTGALLTISGTVTDSANNTTTVNLKVSDKDIHSGVFETPQATGGSSNCEQLYCRRSLSLMRISFRPEPRAVAIRGIGSRALAL